MISREYEDGFLRQAKDDFRDRLRHATYAEIKRLSNYYEDYGGSWSVTIRI